LIIVAVRPLLVVVHVNALVFVVNDL